MRNKRKRKLRLADAGNTYHRALAVIRRKGYHIYYHPDEDEEGEGNLWAIKDQRDFIASDPLRLLGLITMWEQFGDEWRAHHVPDIYGEVINAAFPEDEYSTLTDEEFAHAVEHLRPFFEALWKPLPAKISRGELAHLMKTYYQNKE